MVDTKKIVNKTHDNTCHGWDLSIIYSLWYTDNFIYPVNHVLFMNLKNGNKEIEKQNCITMKWNAWLKLNYVPEVKLKYAHLNFLTLYYRLYEHHLKGFFGIEITQKEIEKIYKEMCHDRKTWHVLNKKVKGYYRDRHAGKIKNLLCLYNKKEEVKP